MKYNVTNKDEFYKKLPLHKKWLNGEDGGEQLVVKPGTDLSCTNMHDANVSGANMSGADMSHADMRGANVRGADMSDADMRGANVRGANMSGANVRGADMRGANVSAVQTCAVQICDADMRGADMRGADMRGAVIPVSNIGDDRGWIMNYQTTDFGLRFYCGCHQNWTYEQCAGHWLADDYPDPLRGKAKMMVIDLIVTMYEAGMLLVKPESILED